MARKKFRIFIFLMIALLLVGCSNTESTYKTWGDFSNFQERFDEMPHSIAHELWQTNQSTKETTIHSTVLWCNDQSRHILEITTNSDGKILGITLQSKEESCCISCFAEASYHVFGSMGFNDKDVNGKSFSRVLRMYSMITFSFSPIRLLKNPCGLTTMKCAIHICQRMKHIALRSAILRKMPLLPNKE